MAYASGGNVPGLEGFDNLAVVSYAPSTTFWGAMDVMLYLYYPVLALDNLDTPENRKTLYDAIELITAQVSALYDIKAMRVDLELDSNQVAYMNLSIVKREA